MKDGKTIHTQVEEYWLPHKGKLRENTKGWGYFPRRDIDPAVVYATKWTAHTRSTVESAVSFRTDAPIREITAFLRYFLNSWRILNIYENRISHTYKLEKQVLTYRVIQDNIQILKAAVTNNQKYIGWHKIKHIILIYPSSEIALHKLINLL